MVDPVQLVSDLLQTAAVYLLPPFLWLFLYLFAWENPTLSTEVGFGRTTFWLLLLAGAIGWAVNLPFFWWGGDVLAVNFGGAVFPIVVACIVLTRVWGRTTDTFAVFFAGFAAIAGTAFVAVLLLPTGGSAFGTSLSWDLLGGAILTLVTLVALFVFVGVLRVARRADLRPLTLVLVLTVGALLATFFTTATVPLSGIVSEFPFYLIAPVLVGIGSVLLVHRTMHLPPRFGLPVAYAASTFGVLIGADLLRQPPLYASSGNIYSIGGAGLLDLVALTGLMALAAAFLTLRMVERPGASAPGPTVPRAPPRRSPIRAIRAALIVGMEGAPFECLRQAGQAARDAALEARRLVGLGLPTDGERPWQGLPVPEWVEADQRNLDALVRTGTNDKVESFRGWLAARNLVRIGRDLALPAFGGIGQRS
jgi:uncharacterized membrane protein